MGEGRERLNEGKKKKPQSRARNKGGMDLQGQQISVAPRCRHLQPSRSVLAAVAVINSR
jgi:hypothetical protein